jgi:hypothetical protein
MFTATCETKAARYTTGVRAYKIRRKGAVLTRLDIYSDVRSERSEIFVSVAHPTRRSGRGPWRPAGPARRERPAAGGRRPAVNGARRELELVRLEPHAAADSALQ